MKRSRSPSLSQFTLTDEKHPMQRHFHTDFIRYKRKARRSAQPTDDPMEANQTQATGAPGAAAGLNVAPATTAANSIYRIHYESLPYNNSPGYASVQEGSGIGFTNDSDLAMLVAEFKCNHRLQGKRWEVQEVRVGVSNVPKVMRMDNGPVELKNGNWATFFGGSWFLANGDRLLISCSVG